MGKGRVVVAVVTAAVFFVLVSSAALAQDMTFNWGYNFRQTTRNCTQGAVAYTLGVNAVCGWWKANTQPANPRDGTAIVSPFTELNNAQLDDDVRWSTTSANDQNWDYQIYQFSLASVESTFSQLKMDWYGNNASDTASEDITMYAWNFSATSPCSPGVPCWVQIASIAAGCGGDCQLSATLTTGTSPTVGAVLVDNASRANASIMVRGRRYDYVGSCPFVYSWDGEQYRLEHEAFPFAAIKASAGASYDRLQYLKEQDGEYRLEVREERKEISWIDRFRFWVVDHPGAESFVMPDLEGQLHTVAEPQEPTACDSAGEDCLEAVRAFDDTVWRADFDQSDSLSAKDVLALKFDKPNDAQIAKLLLKVEKQLTVTKLWQRHLADIGSNRWGVWQKVVSTPPMSWLWQWWQGRANLLVQVSDGSEWRTVGKILPGRELWDDFLIAADVSDIAGEVLNVRLVSPQGFYEVNSVEADFSEDEAMEVRELSPKEALRNASDDVREALGGADDNEVELVKGDRIGVRYDALPPAAEGQHRSFAIAISGYYNYIIPDVSSLADLWQAVRDIARFSSRPAEWAMRAAQRALEDPPEHHTLHTDYFSIHGAQTTVSTVVGATGTQNANIAIGVNSQFLGGAFTIRRSAAGASNLTSVKLTEIGSVAANANIKAYIYRKQEAACSTGSTLPSGTTLFGSATFGSGDVATITGSFDYGTGGAQHCLYVVIDSLNSVPTAGQTLDIEINYPWSDVVVSSGWPGNPEPQRIGGVSTMANMATISGSLYGTDETTALNCTTPIPMKLAVNGTTAYTTNCTGNPGTFSFTGVTATVNDVLTIWLDTNGGTRASLVFNYGTSCTGYANCTGLQLFQNRVVLLSRNGSVISSTASSSCDNDTGSACTDSDIGFTAEGSILTLTWATNELHIPDAGIDPDVTASGLATAQKIHIASSARLLADGEVKVTGSGTSTTCTSASAIPLCVQGTLNKTTVPGGSGAAVTFAGAAATNIPLHFAYGNLALEPPAGVTYTLGTGSSQTLTVEYSAGGDLIAGKSDGSAGGVVDGDAWDPAISLGKTMTIYSNATLIPGTATYTTHTFASFGDVVINGTFGVGGNVTFTTLFGFTGTGIVNLSSTSTVDLRPGGNQIFGTTSGTNNWTFGNLTFSSSSGISSTHTTQTGGTGQIIVVGTLKVSKTGDTVATMLNAGNRTWRLTNGDSTNPLELDEAGGSLTGSTSTFSYEGDNDTGNVTVENAAFNNLVLGGSVTETFALEGAATTTGDLTVNANMTFSGSTDFTAQGAVGAGTINFSGGTFTLDGSGNFGGAAPWTFANLSFGSGGAWASRKVVSSVSNNTSFSLALDAADNPVVSYHPGSGSGGWPVKVLHCDDFICQGVNSITSSGSGWPAPTNSLALDVAGNPVVTYRGDGSLPLMILHCDDSNCAPGGDSIATGANERADAASLMLDAAGFPVVAYFQWTQGVTDDLKILHCNDVNCVGGDESIVAVDTVGSVGLYPSLRLDASGNPVVSYYDQTNADLKVLHCNDPNCAGGDESINSPDTTGNVGWHTSLALDTAGNPVVGYYDATLGDLKILHCNDPNCVAGGDSIASPDTAGSVGEFLSLALDASGNPVVSYWINDSFDLRILRCGDANCTSGNSITSADTTGDVGRYSSLRLDSSGNPVVAYYDQSNSSLKVGSTPRTRAMGAGTITVNGTLTVNANTTLDLNTNDKPVDANGAVTISGTLQAPSDPATSFTVAGNFTNTGSIAHNGGTVTLDGTTSTTFASGCAGVTVCPSDKYFGNLTINKTSGTDANDNVSFATNGLRLDGTLTITDGELVQSSTFNVWVGAVSVAAAGKWNNDFIDSQGDLTLAGTFTNNGSVSFNSTGDGCTEGDVILLRSSVSGTPRAWAGTGTFNMQDLDVQDQGGSAAITVQGGTCGSPNSNAANWTFNICGDGADSTCGAPSSPATGELTSTTFDTQIANPTYNSLLWKGTAGTGKVRFQFASSDCSNGATNPPTCDTGTWSYVAWDGSSCNASAWYDAPNPNIGAEILGASQCHLGHQYYRYYIQLCLGPNCTETTGTSPSVEDVVVSWSP
ncbi:MAG: hypothetical protein A2991_02140 [Candidatus Terrybacteria bacterium RIFCSPLOWO2_01_FULL_58_14]|uniref:Uncharacterized protein n=1 Tax=Candidatus Terrybacteria bacterium RIFCSPLOWO2_01_FULL_58_14 TaxID=1802369 RepID=A0A1G2PZ68_9BACT|nr:MAG: hypothetical protein A2991_02140 [Candidatus Terrybacteria bacterium RIFCSPLOWO2_01_FULL_58_14]